MKKNIFVIVLSMILIFGAVALCSACHKEQEPQFSVYYSGGEGATGRSPEPAQFRKGDTVTLVENVFFHKPEYEFAGWNISGTEYSVGDSFEMPANDVTVEARWVKTAALIYSFGLHPHAAQNAALPPPVQQRVGSYVTLPAVEAESGYSFAGWLATGESIPRAAGSRFTLTQNVTLTAQWAVLGKVVYHANGGTGADPSEKSYASGETVLVGENPYQREGYRFAGWKVTAGGNDVAVYEDGGQYRFTMPEGDAVVSALWKREHTLVYSFGAGGENHGTGNAPSDPNRYAEGDPVTFTAQTVFAAIGWKFDGWRVSCVNSQTEVGVTSGGFTMPDDDVVATAQWAPVEYTVSYARSEEALPSESVKETVTVESNGGKLILKEASLFESQAGVFGGWLIGNAVYEAGAVVNILEILPADGVEIKIVAQWSDRFRAEYSFGETGFAHGAGTVPVDPSDYAAGDAVGLYAGTVSAEKGWRFLGWRVTKKSDGSQVTVVSGEEGDTFEMPAGGVLISATWAEIAYKIVYLRGDHSVAESDITEENVTITDHGGIYTLRAAYAAAQSYRFAGWRSGDTVYREQEEVSFSLIIPSSGEEIVFTAQWEELFEVTFDLDGGNWGSATAILSGLSVEEGYELDFADYDEPQRTGYVFKGWLSLDAQGGLYRKGTPDSVYRVTGQASFRAQWARAVTVKFYDSLGNLNANIAPVKTVTLEEGAALGDIFPDLGIPMNWYLAVKGEGGYDLGQPSIGSYFVIESSLIQEGDDAVYICASEE